MKNLHTQKNNVKAVMLLIAITFLSTNQLQAQSVGSTWGHERALLVTNDDNANAFGQLRMQTGKISAFTFSNFTDRMSLSYVLGTVHREYGEEIFTITDEGKVGINKITTPENELHVKGYGRFEAYNSADNYLRVGHGSGNSFIDFNGAGNLDFRYNGDYDNNLMRLTPNGNLGIGTDSPTEKLEVAGNILASGNVTSNGNIQANNALIVGESQLSSSTTDAESTLTITGNISTDDIEANQINADQVTSNQVETVQVNIGQSQLSSVTENENTLLMVAGGVKTDKVVLNIGSFPDYVFENDYKLMPIKEVANYIAKNKHLPNIPSEKEMVATGLDVNMISLKLVEKVEELTLYTIQQEEKLKTQNQLILTLTKRLDDLERKETKQ